MDLGKKEYQLKVISKHMSEICGYQIKAFPTTPETRGLLKKMSPHLLSCTDPDCVKQFKKQDRLLDHPVKGITYMIQTKRIALKIPLNVYG